MEIGIDPERSEWMEHPDFEELEILVVSSESKVAQSAYHAELDRQTKQRRGQIGTGILRRLEERALLIQSAACCRGWRAKPKANGEALEPVTFGGQELEWSEDACLQLARDPAYKPFFDGVFRLATRLATADAEARRESLGN